jgi:hypothetical protein
MLGNKFSPPYSTSPSFVTSPLQLHLILGNRFSPPYSTSPSFVAHSPYNLIYEAMLSLFFKGGVLMVKIIGLVDILVFGFR